MSQTYHLSILTGNKFYIQFQLQTTPEGWPSRWGFLWNPAAKGVFCLILQRINVVFPGAKVNFPFWLKLENQQNKELETNIA